LDPLRVLDPVVMPLSCCAFLPVAPGLTGLTFPSLEAPGAVWLCADARSVEPKSDVTIRAENASLDRIKDVSVELQDPAQTSCDELVPTHRKHSEKLFFNNFSVIAARTSSHFTNIRHLPNIPFAQSASISFVPIDER
jgi:hypothetical protein